MQSGWKLSAWMPASNPLAAVVEFKRFFKRQIALEIFDEHLVLADDQDFGHRFVFQFAQRHSVFFQKLNQVFAWNASVL